MEVRKYNPFVVIKANPKPKPKPKVRSKSKPKLEAGGLSRMDGVLSLENKKKLDIIYAKGFVNTNKIVFLCLLEYYTYKHAL